MPDHRRDHHPSMHDRMREATRLTRAGRLHEATALIQRTLLGAQDTPPGAPHHGGTSRPTGGRAPGEREPAVTVPSTVVRTERTPGTGQRTGTPHGGAPHRREAQVSVRGRFVTASLANAAGRRSYRVYVPARPTDGALPLIVLLHGCTQDAGDFATGTRMNALAEQHGFIAVYPEQASSANPSRCWNWFKTEDQRRDRGEPSIIADITRTVAAGAHADPERVYVAGMSAGGAMAAVMGATHPDLFAAVGVHSGLPYRVASDLPSAFRAMKQGPSPDAHGGTRPRRPVIVFHGDRDQTVHLRNAEHILRGYADGGRHVLSVHAGQASGGLGHTRYVYRDGTSVRAEGWVVHGLGHAWSGGDAAGSHTDARGPDASAEMVRFFAQHRISD